MHFQPPFVQKDNGSLSSLFEAIIDVVGSWPQIWRHFVATTAHANTHGLGSNQLQLGRQFIHVHTSPLSRTLEFGWGKLEFILKVLQYS